MDNNSLWQRLQRYASVAGGVSSVAIKHFLGKEHNVGDLLGNLKGPAMKVGQVLSMVPGLLPQEYEQELQQLQRSAPPMGPFFVKRRMAGELGPDWQKKFQQFDLKPFASASLGQVHRAADLEGRTLACKLQYPCMEATVEADLKQLKLLLGLYESWKPGLETSKLYQEVADRLMEELDYKAEAQNMKVFEKIFEHNHLVQIPRCYSDLSTKKLLTMEYSEGRSIHDYNEASQYERNQIGRLLFHQWYYPLYNYGVLHGDPHMGNYAFNGEQLCLYDFGCVRYYSGRHVQNIIDLYKALQQRDEDMLAEAFYAWGFEKLTKPLIDALKQWALFLFEPLLENRERLLLPEGPQKYAIAQEVHKALREQGGVQPPREFVFLDRAAVGIGSAMIRLGAEANWHRLFEGMIEGFDAGEMDNRQQLVFKETEG